jgi:glyoxylase-like metal-dependent hydrolase (beta-lactamase superfamily II)
MTRTYLRDHLEPVRDQMVFHHGEGEVIPGIRVMNSPGHTWGQQAVVFADAEGTVIFPGDVMPTRAHSGLPYNMAYDMEPYTNVKTKSRLFEKCAREGWRWVIDHEPGDAIIRIEESGEGSSKYRLTPVEPVS